MNQLRAVDVQEVMTRSGEALSKASGGTVVLGEMEVLSNDDRRNFIARAAARYGTLKPTTPRTKLSLNSSLRAMPG